MSWRPWAYKNKRPWTDCRASFQAAGIPPRKLVFDRVLPSFRGSLLDGSANCRLQGSPRIARPGDLLCTTPHGQGAPRSPKWRPFEDRTDTGRARASHWGATRAPVLALALISEIANRSGRARPDWPAQPAQRAPTPESGPEQRSHCVMAKRGPSLTKSARGGGGDAVLGNSSPLHRPLDRRSETAPK